MGFLYIGEFDKVLETFEFLIGSCDKESGVFRKYEDRLIKACDDKAISTDNLVEFIIAGEKLKLDKLLSSAITLASKCYSRSLKNHVRYNAISEDTKNKINEKRVPFLEDNGNNRNANLRM